MVDTMSKISNILTMINLLNTGRQYTINELANVLEVTPRMIRIYKEELEKAGIYITTIRGKYGGYILDNTIKMPLKKITKEDIKLLKDLNNSSLESLINKLEDKLVVSENLLNNENKKKYNDLNKAIKEKRKVRIVYYSYNKGENIRIINPISFFIFSNGLYLAAFCELRKDIRHFELNRIKNYEVLKDIFE